MPRLEDWKMPRVVRWVLTKYYANGLKEPIEEETAALKDTKEWLNLYFSGK